MDQGGRVGRCDRRGVGEEEAKLMRLMLLLLILVVGLVMVIERWINMVEGME